MNGSRIQRKYPWIWILVPIVVLAELICQWRIPGQVPSTSDWNAAVTAVKKLKGPSDLVVIAPAWADPEGRMYFKDLITMADFGRFDTTKYEQIFEVSIGDAKSPERGNRDATRTMTFGRLTVSQIPLPKPADVKFDFLENWQYAHYENTPERSPTIVIDHWFHPRQVLPFDLKKPSSIAFSEVPLNGTLRGYAVIGYREGRFNKGSPIRLRILVNGKKIGEKLIANFSPITPFEYPLDGEGKGTVTFEVLAENNKKREFGIAVDIRNARTK